jgi:hypothetical protein
VFKAAALALKPNGYSIHVVDHVLEGKGDTWHTEQNLAVLRQQYRLAGNRVAENDSLATFHQLLNSARNDLETFLLAPQGHNLWRGGQAYDAFPFRKCIAIQTIVRRTASSA